MVLSSYEFGEQRICILQALFSDGGYTYLDVRPQIEFEDLGKVKVSRVLWM